MNYIWCIMILISLISSAISGNLSETVTAGLSGASEGLTVVLSFAGVMCLWTGLLKCAEKSGLCEIFKKLFIPIIKLIFPKMDMNSSEANYIILNVTADVLGTGNGATPMGIKAMNHLSESAGDKPSEEMCIFTVMNTAAFQLLPTSIIALRTSAESTNPLSVVVPIWICSGIALVCGIVCVKLMFKIFIKERN